MFEYDYDLFQPAIFSAKQIPKLEESEKEFKKLIKQRSSEAIAAASDFVLFRKYVCGHDTFDHMMVWHHALNTGEDNKFLRGIAGENTCILSPRNSAKSSYLLQWVTWIIGTHAMQGISLKILYISYVIDVARGKSRQMQAIIESDAYQEVFPMVKPSKDKWSESEWAIDFTYAGLRAIDESYTLACSGLAGAINSKRSHLIIFDDLIKNPSEAKNKKIQDRMMENYHNIIRFTKHDGARFVNLGTRMAKHDVYATTFIAENKWKVIKQSAIIKDGDTERSFWEAGIALETLQQERIDDEESFLLQRQNEIPETSSVGIKYHHIKFGWMPKSFDRIIIGADTANSTDENSNATAFVVLGIANDCIYVVDGHESRTQGSLKKIDCIYDLWYKRKHQCKHPAILAVDWNSHAMGLEGDLNTYIEDLHLDVSLDQDFAALIIEKIKSSNRGEKIDRIESHSYLFEKGRVIFNRISPTNENNDDIFNKLINEITDHNPLEHNDLMDALEVGLYVARQYVSGNLSVIA